MPVDAANALESLRTRTALRVLVQDVEDAQVERLWCRANTSAIFPELFSVLGAAHYRVVEGQLIPLHQRVPIGSLPSGEWMPIAEWMQCTLPFASLEPRELTKVPIRLVRSEEAQRAKFLRCRLSDWKAWVLRSTAIRLLPLRFVCAGEQVLITGDPLPPIPGDYWYGANRVALPSGWTWDPPVSSDVLWDVVSAAAADAPDLALFHEDGRLEFVSAADWCPATYAAVRATTKESLHG